MRALLGTDALVVTPGVRPADEDAGDQARTATPAEAIAAGASHLVDRAAHHRCCGSGGGSRSDREGDGLMTMTDADVLAALKEAGAILHGHFQLTSGRHSDTYVQCARVLEDPALTTRLAAGDGRDPLPTSRSILSPLRRSAASSSASPWPRRSASSSSSASASRA